jgi:dCTP deaminase
LGLLSEIAIRKALASGDLKIEPAPDQTHFDSDSVEVHLGDQVYTWRKPSGGAITTMQLWAGKGEPGAFNYNQFSKENLVHVAPDPDGIVTMRPLTFYLADLKQRTELPPWLAMHIQGKSTLARLGVMVHLTAPHAHAGWRGRLALEMYNLGPFNIELKPGTPMGQLTFWRVEEPPRADDIVPKAFSGQEKATGEK